MPDVIFPGPEGRLEGRFSPAPRPRAPVALILHPHPQGGGTMNDRITQALYKTFVKRGFATLRFNFRGVGRSQGVFDNGIGELSDAASALDWIQSFHQEAQTTWIAGFSFGAWISMQLLMRRPEIRGFISVAPPANMYDFSFLAPCPASGIIVQGINDEVVSAPSVQKLVDKLRTQKGITVHHDEIRNANHFFEHELDQLMMSVDNYLDMRLAPEFANPIKVGPVTVILAGSIRLPAEKRAQARPVMQAMIDASRAEEGCLAYSFAEDLLEPGLIRIFEVFRDAEAQKLHAESPHMQAWRAAWPALEIGDRQIERFDISGAGAN